MKYTLLLLSIIAFSAQAQTYRQYGDNRLTHDQVMRGGMGIAPYSAYDGVRRTERNIFGGEDYYGTRGYMGRSIPNVHGGRDFYPATTVD